MKKKKKKQSNIQKEKKVTPTPMESADRAGKPLTWRKNPGLTYLTAFFLPAFLLLTVWACNGVQPFGTRMILAHDQWHQYYPFFVSFRERLLSGHSLFYSWDTGMGTNFLALYGYYLASPLNWLALLTRSRNCFNFWNIYKQKSKPPVVRAAYCFFNSGRSKDEICNYIGKGNIGYGWHISDLVIYDKPKELSEFNHCGTNYHSNPKIISQPPHGWCYAEEVR